MSKKKRFGKRNRTSLGREGSPAKARTSFGMKRLLNQLEAHRKGKNTRVVVPSVKDGKHQFVTLPGSAVWGKTLEQRRKEQSANAG